ncbi:hypothetical protein ACFP1I_01655 [Dyadobacter subterraneus]|uniref:PH domain-containing protein n=1 Tax=Dyadobacter subterraneus TaxID=2773304 RepID=A0ABR9W7L0_9BACT|nr:hypothetical protein [Dyadobacter subterraneus]MBE9461457.1 hypothetical protein [Dyadobacter subterraneus]
MKNFRFEYTINKTLVTIFLSSFLLGLLISTKLPDLGSIFGIPLKVVLPLCIPIFSMIFCIDMYKKRGEASIKENVLEMNLDGVEHIIPFEKIKTFEVQYGNGTRLVLNLRNQPKLKIFANDHFCKSDLFYAFCNELEKVLIEYGKTSSVPITRKPSPFESKWALNILVVSTVIFFGMLIRAAALHHDVQRSALSGFGALAILWGAWFLAFIKKKHLEN